MSGQLFPAAMALLLGGFAGVLLFVPFVAVQYRREGGLTLRQGLLWAAFLVYALALWTYTLLPLPDPDAIRCVSAQLHPFQFLDDARQYPTGSITALGHNPAVVQVAMNVLLFVPLGFFLRLAWRRGVAVTTVAGLVVSLAIETTQLTGVWGVYACGYRLFDVDDLIANTTGALLGGALSAVLRPWLSHGEGSETPGPRPVTFWRRFVGMVCDVLAVALVGAVAGIAVNAWQLYVRGVAPEALDPAAADIAATAVPFALFVVVSVVVLIVAKRRGGLPGVVSRAHPVDARQPAAKA